MSILTELSPPDGYSFAPTLLDESDHEGLLRITRLVEHLFRVPIAYVALFGSDLTVVKRLGSGREYWRSLKRFPLRRVARNPAMWPDPAGKSAPRFQRGDLRFAASAPLQSSTGFELGILVIADLQPRPEFTAADLEIFAELAKVLARKLELRMIACEARTAELTVQEGEQRFRNIANSAPVLMICSGADGITSFVSKAWLEFTGGTFEEEVGEGFVDRFHPDYREPMMQKYWDAFTARQPYTEEFPLRRHDGVYRWMRAQGVPRFRSDGAFAGYIGCFVDVTGERASRIDIQKQKLVCARLADAAGMFYMLLDRDGVIEDLGPGDPADLRQHVFWEVSGIGDGAVLRQAFVRAVTGGQMVESVVSCSFPAGNLAERRWSFSPIVPAEPDSLAVLVMVELN